MSNIQAYANPEQNAAYNRTLRETGNKEEAKAAAARIAEAQAEARAAKEAKEEQERIETENRQKLESFKKDISEAVKDNRYDDSNRNINFEHLRYPKEKMESTQDYISFEVIKYKRKPANEGGLTGGPKGSTFDTETKFNNRDLNKKITNTITLPVPASIADSNSADYGQSGLNFLQEFGLRNANSMMDAGKDPQALRGLYDAFLNAMQATMNLGLDNQNLAQSFLALQAINSFGGNLTLGQLMARSNGQIINPNMELLFNGPALREFRFQFKFTPRFREEGEEVRKIIRTFKKHSAPKGGTTSYLKTPDIFQIRYLGEGGTSHPFLNRFKLCALTNMSVNYTGDGTYATYDNGTPVSMTMDLNFKELTPVYDEDYNTKVGGVGY